MSKMTIETEQEKDGVVIDNDTKETVEDTTEEIAEAIAEEIEDNVSEDIVDASVAIAAIDADKEIKLAEIEAETKLELQANEIEREERQWTELQELKDMVSALTVRLETLEQSTPPTLTEAAQIAEAVSAEAMENNSTPQFMSPSINETKTEVILESEGEKQAQATVEVKQKRRLI